MAYIRVIIASILESLTDIKSSVLNPTPHFEYFPLKAVIPSFSTIGRDSRNMPFTLLL